MGYTTSTVHGIEVPDSSETNNIPEDIGKVVTALEGGSIVRRLTGAQIAALTGPQKPAGTVVYNTTTGTLQMSNGSTFVDVVDATGANMTGPLVIASNAVLDIGDEGASRAQFYRDATYALAIVPSDGSGTWRTTSMLVYVISSNTWTFQTDVELNAEGTGLILRSPNGTRYRVRVSDAGAVTTTAL